MDYDECRVAGLTTIVALVIIIWTCLIFGIGNMTGLAEGIRQERTKWEREAIASGCGEYWVPESGVVVFQWKD